MKGPFFYSIFHRTKVTCREIKLPCFQDAPHDLTAPGLRKLIPELDFTGCCVGCESFFDEVGGFLPSAHH